MFNRVARFTYLAGAAQAQTTGADIDVERLTEVHHLDAETCVVDVSVRWLDLIARGLALGVKPAMVPFDLHRTVGGALAFDGITGATFRSGLIADHVSRLEVITRSGTLEACSSTENPELFEAALSGSNPRSSIVRATLRMVKARDDVRTYTATFGDLGSLLKAMSANASQTIFDELAGSVIATPMNGWAYEFEGVIFHDRTETLDDDCHFTALANGNAAKVIFQDADYAAWMMRFSSSREHWLGSGSREESHPTLRLSLPEDSAMAFLRETLPVLDGEELAGIPIRIHSLVARSHGAGQSAFSNDTVSFAITIARIPPDEDAVSLMVDQDQFLIERARRYGGQALGQHAFARHAFGGHTARTHASRGHAFGDRTSSSIPAKLQSSSFLQSALFAAMQPVSRAVHRPKSVQ